MSEWTPSETLALRLLVQQGKLPEQITQQFKAQGIERTHQSIRRKIQEEAKRNPGEWRALVATGGTKIFNEPALVTAGKVLIVADVHAPFHDAPWLNRVIGVALKRQCTHAIIAGDLVDFSAFSKWGRQERVEAEDEIQSARQVITALARNFKGVTYFGGNHESRLSRATNNNLAIQSVMDMFDGHDNLTISPYFWCTLVSSGVQYYVEHPKNISVHATLVAKALCAKYNTNVIAGHGHDWGMARDVGDRHWAIDTGMCADPDRLAYNAVVHNTRPKMKQGAALVLEGQPVLLSPHNIAALGG